MRAKPPESRSFGEQLQAALTGFWELSPAQLEALEAHYRLLARWNSRMNLTAIRSQEEVVIRHYAESAFLASVLVQFQPGRSRIVDFGSGAGFPGVPVAILLPASEVTLLEANQRKAAFLRESTRTLRNVTVLSRRGEEVSGSWDWLVSRAVRLDDVVHAGRRLAPRLALLVSGESVRVLDRSIEWHPPIPVPWADDSFVLIGDVPRET